jgi:hypothetical protein
MSDPPPPAAPAAPSALDALFAFHDSPEEAVAGVLDTLVGGRFAEEVRAARRGAGRGAARG